MLVKQKEICLSLHYNGKESYLCVNIAQMYLNFLSIYLIITFASEKGLLTFIKMMKKNYFK